jgi:predicted nucleic acid-binding protein
MVRVIHGKRRYMIDANFGSLDMLIAAHALAVGAVLVTNDRAFSQIAQLQIEDWTVA